MRSFVSVGVALLATLWLSGVAAAFPGGAELEILSLEGTVTSQQIEKKGKDGEVVTATVYVLESDGKQIKLPEAKVKGGQEPAYQLADFVGAEVKIAAHGVTKRGKDGGSQIYVHRITSIEKVEA